MVLMIDGQLEPATLSTTSNPAGATVTGDGFTMTIAGVDAQGSPLPLTANGNVQVDPGRYVRVQGTGFAQGSNVDVRLFSNPTYLGRLAVDSLGTFDGQLLIPLDVPVGMHTLPANGTTTDSAQRSVSLPVEVNPTATTLAFTGGSDPLAALVVALLLLLPSFLGPRSLRATRAMEAEQRGRAASEGAGTVSPCCPCFPPTLSTSHGCAPPWNRPNVPACTTTSRSARWWSTTSPAATPGSSPPDTTSAN